MPEFLGKGLEKKKKKKLRIILEKNIHLRNIILKVLYKYK